VVAEPAGASLGVGRLIRKAAAPTAAAFKRYYKSLN